MPLIFRTEYQEECSTSYEQECSTSYETTYEQQCSTSYETVCEEAQSSYGGSSGGYGAPSAPKCSQVPKQNCQQVILFKRMALRFSYFFYQGPQANSQAELSASAQTELPTEASPGSRHQMLSGQSFNYRLVIHPYNNSFEDNYDHYSLEFQPECFSD